jgi:hypothetical protein
MLVFLHTPCVCCILPFCCCFFKKKNPISSNFHGGRPGSVLVDSKVPNLETPDGCTNIWMATVGYLQLGTFCPAPVATCTHLLLLGTTQKHHSSPPKSRSRHTTLRLTATSPEKVRFSPTTRRRYHLLGAFSPLPSSQFIYLPTAAADVSVPTSIPVSHARRRLHRFPLLPRPAGHLYSDLVFGCRVSFQFEV